MTQAKLRFATFDEYLSYDDGSGRFYELLNGELIEVPPESGENLGILAFLFLQFSPLVGYLRVRWGLELEVRGEPKNRYPDLTILQSEHIQPLQRRNTIRLSMLPPLLVVEVVSPGEVQRERDYIAKRVQYQDRGIPEYWLIDPGAALITILVLINNEYESFGVYQDADRIESPTLGKLEVTAGQVLQAGQV